MDFQRLDDCFFANSQAKHTLAALISGGRISHGILLTGERGLGKKTFARIIAAAVLCMGQQAPCLHCTSCKKVLSGNHPDVTLYAGDAQKARSFHIDTVRELRRKALFKPGEADTKVFILANCDAMTVQAQNALLKLLEEPPENTVLILTAASRDALLETVLSRVSEIRLQPLEPQECAQRLCALHPDKDVRQCEDAARLSAGNFGRAQELLLDENAGRAAELAMQVLSAAVQSEYAVLLALNSAQGDRTLFVQVLDRLILLCRDILAAKLGAPTSLSGERIPNEILRVLTRAKAMRVLESIQQAQRMLLQNAQQPLVASWLCTKICA